MIRLPVAVCDVDHFHVRSEMSSMCVHALLNVTSISLPTLTNNVTGDDPNAWHEEQVLSLALGCGACP